MASFALNTPTMENQRSSQTLLLDSQIRDWVVLPLLVLMIAAGLLRSQIGKYLRPAPKPIKTPDARAKSALQRSSRLRGGAGGFLSGNKWEARRLAWSAREGPAGSGNVTNGWLRQEAVAVQAEKEAEKLMSAEGGNNGEDLMPGGLPGMDPSTMMDGMKGNMAAMVQNMVMMQGISHFFRGFVLVRVPFPLTRGFKQMFQRGLFDLNTLDTSYVSSVSWYFLVMYGLRAFFRLVMGEPLQEEMEGIEIQKELGREFGGGPPNQFDGAKALKAEADNLELLNKKSRRFHLDDAERKFLGKRYPKRSTKISGKAGAGADILFGLSSVGKGKVTGPSNKKKSS
ncbi:hypothetical protein ACHAXS_006372 [Conticribra weissflogii]